MSKAGASKASKAKAGASKSVASKSKPQTRRKGSVVVDQALIDAHLNRLENLLGEEPGFSSAFEAMKADTAVGQDELLAIARQFVGPIAASTSRAKILERMLKRHTNLLTFKLKQRAVAGRSAA